ncbi:MAG: cob(I)yrinic acid a,c-diamide adenosyltransferase [Candidatus Sumerlaeaceae bacterium]|nr:cob(I)yrinic acid a,c-diamide adenosyltransferase [Candidatus Sumerlaeaceae bacterium]
MLATETQITVHEGTAPRMGYLHVYTGNGKGKTTCAVGLTIRALGAGHRVAFMQFDKGFEGKNEHYHERFILRSLPHCDLFFYGMERMMPDGRFRFANIPEDLEQARAGLEKAKELVRSGKYFLVVCDEAITCVGTKLYGEDDLLSLVEVFKSSPTCDLVLTGRSAFPRLIEAADLVSEVNLVKHYFYSGVEARKGIEY